MVSVFASQHPSRNKLPKKVAATYGSNDCDLFDRATAMGIAWDDKSCDMLE
jgi:hypothetical protein